MTTMLRIAAAVVLLLVAGCGQESPAPSPPADSHAGHHDHDTGAPAGHGHASDVDTAGDGRSATAGGYTLDRVRFPDAPGKGTLSFRIRNDHGQPHTRFQREQAKLMHVYVVRTDLADFDHVHPDMAADGTWTTPLTLERPGTYRVVTEFVATGHHGPNAHVVLGDDITVGGPHTDEPLPGTDAPVRADGYELHLFGDLTAGEPTSFKIHFTHGGDEVTDLEPYLEAYAHLTGFRRGDLTTVHLHPEESAKPGGRGGPMLAFHAEFDKPGTYRLFIQFQTGGRLHTAPATVRVS